MAKAKPNPERDLLMVVAKMVWLLAVNGNPRTLRDELDKAIAAVEGEKDADG